MVLNFELICDSIEWIHQFTYYDSVKNAEFTNLSEIITIELPKLGISQIEDNRFDSQKLMPWLEFISADNKEDVMLALEKYPELQAAYEKLQILSYDEARVIEYNKRLMWFYDEVSNLECMKEIKESFKNAVTELNEVQNELYDTKSELKGAQAELQGAQAELQIANEKIHAQNIETAKKAFEMDFCSKF